MASPVPQKDDVERWTVEQVAAWLRQMEMNDCCESFLRRGIDGRSLMELTEEGLVLWVRDVSIRNSKKIMKLIKQIKNQHLISTGKCQPSQLRQSLGTPLSSHPSSDQGFENGEGHEFEHDDDDNSFTSDDFDDDDVEGEEPLSLPHSKVPVHQRCEDSPESDSEDLYLQPIPAPASGRVFPTPPQRLQPKKPIVTSVNHQPHQLPVKRPPMPLPHVNANQVVPSNVSERTTGPKLPPEILIRVPGEPPRRPPPVPGPVPSASTNPKLPNPKPFILKPLREWPPKKPSEPSANVNSNQSESSSSDGGGISGRKGITLPHRPVPVPPLKEDTDNEYEIVIPPPDNNTGSDRHGSSHGLLLSNPEPPPLPERNQDGRDGGGASHGRVNNLITRLQRGIPSAQTPNANQSRPPPPTPRQHNKPLPLPSVPSSQDSSQKGTSGGATNSFTSRMINAMSSSVTHTSSPMPFQQHSKDPVSSPPSEMAPGPPGGLPLGVERVTLGDGETIDLTPLYRSLMDKPYFHLIFRSKSKSLLENAADGVFLIRPSTRSSDPLTLCLRYGGRTYNINIRRRHDLTYALGKQKASEITFKCVDDIVSTYTNEPIKLQNEGRVILTTSPAKSDHIYVKLPNSFKKNY